ncbi:MCP four helix bundle domain-containing protein [Desulfosudis oleivorans]|uniref:Histidine kinase HAMP region domain protein n=1 Tax=Desulfosudis oleivorans (strain DSM 6200 / JCM 39069 / Hxd3) TaxID=96561 RepID=A8ZYS0_DESOH|nr:HAMP domain-containing protein [Desulfosudis oleivorans]ABW67175.1 histidine kinase HAMP region domain protein [Desulfosudis oleivorans Hxd3]
MNLRFKILSGFLILAVMLSAAGAASIYELNRIGHSVKGLLEENYRSIVAAKEMIEALERQDSGVLMLMSGNWEAGRATLEEGDRAFAQAFGTAKSNITITGEAEVVDAIETAYAEFQTLWRRPIVDTHRQGNITWYFDRAHPAFLKTKTAANQLMTLNDTTLYETASALQDRARRAIMPGIIAIASALAFALIFNFFINLYVIAPIRRLTDSVKAFMYHGEPLAVRAEGRDELFKLTEAIRELTIHPHKNGTAS